MTNIVSTYFFDAKTCFKFSYYVNSSFCVNCFCWLAQRHFFLESRSSCRSLWVAQSRDSYVLDCDDPDGRGFRARSWSWSQVHPVFLILVHWNLVHPLGLNIIWSAWFLVGFMKFLGTNWTISPASIMGQVVHFLERNTFQPIRFEPSRCWSCCKNLPFNFRFGDCLLVLFEG